MLGKVNEILLNYVLMGKTRTKVYLSLLDELQTPSDIAKNLNIHLSSVCRSIKDLERNKIIVPISNNINGKNLYKINEKISTIEFKKIIKSIAISRKLI